MKQLNNKQKQNTMNIFFFIFEFEHAFYKDAHRVELVIRLWNILLINVHEQLLLQK